MTSMCSGMCLPKEECLLSGVQPYRKVGSHSWKPVVTGACICVVLLLVVTSTECHPSRESHNGMC